jgi:hypothetical protein
VNGTKKTKIKDRCIAPKSTVERSPMARDCEGGPFDIARERAVVDSVMRQDF